MTSEELLRRLRDAEDTFVERKSKGVAADELRKTVVGFANSLGDGRTAVLYIGVADDGTVQGVDGTDSLQKTIRRICQSDCYPPIPFESEVLSLDGKLVLAVTILPSTDRPHFSGPAYVRRGSETVAASKEVFDELITARLAKCRELLKAKAAGQFVTVVTRGKKLGEVRPLGDKNYSERHECMVFECHPQLVRLESITTGRRVSEPMQGS